MFNFLLAKVHMFFYTGKEIGYFLVTNVTTQIYARITNKKIEQDVMRVADQLNAFNSFRKL